jgi:hypothetical protein
MLLQNLGFVTTFYLFIKTSIELEKEMLYEEQIQKLELKKRRLTLCNH